MIARIDRAGAALGALLLMLGAEAARAELAVVAIDRKVESREGKMVAAESPAPDSVQVLDLASDPPRLLGEVAAATTVGGPPTTVAIAPDESIAIVTGGLTLNESGSGGLLVPADMVTVIDLQARPPAVVAELKSGAGPAGVAFTPKGDLALIANRAGDSVSVFSVAGTEVAKVIELKVGSSDTPGPSGVAVSPDGTTALVTLDQEHAVALLAIDGTAVSVQDRLLTTGLRPYAVAASPDGKLAAVANMGRGKGDMETVSLVDLAASPPRVVSHADVGIQPEGLAFSPDGKLLAVGLQNGSQVPKSAPHYHESGILALYAVAGQRLDKLDEAPLDGWSQGLAFSKDGSRLFAQSMMGKRLQIFTVADGKLTDTGKSVPLDGGGAALRTAGQ